MAKKKKKLKVVLDTNVFINALPDWSKNRIIVDKLFVGAYEIYVSTEIIMEYEEKIRAFFDEETAELILGALRILPNVKHQEPFYHWLMIVNDADDDKFADCAFASNSNYLVTDDKHFNVLKKRIFPSINLIKIDEFTNLLKNL